MKKIIVAVLLYIAVTTLCFGTVAVFVTIWNYFDIGGIGDVCS